MTLTPVAQGHLATVVTALAMTERPKPRPMLTGPLRLRRPTAVDPRLYRVLFSRVGSKWLWYSRLAMDDAGLIAAMGEVHVVEDRQRIEVGMIELERRGATTLIRFLGLIPPLAGKGLGQWLIAQALMLAWRKETERVELYTCTLDHPAALPAYLRAGFKATARSFETFPDPRVTGLLPRDCAPQVPILE